MPTDDEWSTERGGGARARPLGSQSFVLGAAAVLVGVLAAGGVYLFKRWIEVVQSGAAQAGSAGAAVAGPWVPMLVPAVGGLLVGAAMTWLIGRERHHGVAGIMEAVALHGGRLRYRRLPVKIAAAGVSIGAGASVGPEDPSVQLGSGLGSLLGQRLRLSDDRLRSLVAAGAASGIAAAFDAPIAGVFFALEILLGEIAGGAVGLVLLAAVCSSTLTHAIAGDHPAFQVPAYEFRSPWELAAYLVLGVLAGLVSSAYVTALYAARDAFGGPRVPAVLRPALAGLVVGAVGLALPAVLGVGYVEVERILRGEDLVLGSLVALLAAKLAMTALSIGAGFPGGVFAPSLFLGATLGGVVGLAVSRVAPGLGVDPPAFAMVGMGAVLSGAVHAPLTSILLLFEMTRDYRIMLPTMLAAAAALVVSRAVRKDSVYTLALSRKGVRLQQGRDVEVLEGLTVGETMQTVVPTLRDTDAAPAAWDAVRRTRDLGLAVLDAQGALVGVVTAQDLDRARLDGTLERSSVGDVCTRRLLVATPGETLAAALRRMSARDVGRLPVVDPESPTRLVGMLRRADVVRAYDVALTRRSASRG